MTTRVQKQSIRDIIVQDAVETAVVNGLCVKATSDPSSFDFVHAPVSLFPTPYPKKFFDHALKLQPSLGIMVKDLVSKPDHIHSILKYFKEIDPLMKNLLSISTAFNQQIVRQDIHLCILRSDFMIDKDSNSLKLVEYNTIAAGNGCLSQKASELQSYIRDKYEGDIQYNYERPSIEADGRLGVNYIRELVNIFNKTISLYKESMVSKYPEHNTKKENIWVAFVIEKIERNVCDQKIIENELYKNHGIKSMRVTFEAVRMEAEVDPVTKILKIRGREIGFVYYRTGYQIEQYATDEDWTARETLECAMAIKCPSIDIHLTTFKKFQQAFGDETLLKNVMKEHQQEAEDIKGLFKGIWTLEDLEQEDSETHEIVKKAKVNPRNYVIKPQKEGGGNNFYNEEVKEMLENASVDALKPYLIMERINPPEIKAFMMRNGKIIEGSTLSELGIFSCLYIDTTKSEPMQNENLGFLFRTKGKESNEGGVNAGFAVLDTPLVVDIADIDDEITPTVTNF